MSSNRITRTSADLQPVQQRDNQPKTSQPPHGLKAILKAFEPARNTSQAKLLTGKKVANLTKDEEIGGHLKYQAPKTSGVEPGVVAKKKWKDKDTEKLSIENSKLRNAALHEIENSQKSENQGFKRLITDTFVELGSKATSEDILEAILMKGGDSLKQLSNRLEETHLKFNKKHFVKLAYEKISRGHVSIDPKRLMQLKNIGWVRAKIYSHYSTRETPREKNFGAVIETLANDLYTQLGFGGQKLKLQLSEYGDKKHTPRLLLDGTAIQGFHDFRDQIQGGQLSKNQVKIKSGEGEDKTKLPIEEKALAKAFILSLLGADRDKVGGDGGNIGFIADETKATLQNIDPGKSLPYTKDKTHTKRSIIRSIANKLGKVAHFFFGKTDLMKDYSFKSDFSFKPPRKTIPDKFLTMYANFSILQDTSLLAKVQAWREIDTPENRAAIDQLFDDYAATFNREDQSALHFKKEIDELKKSFNDRLNTFAARLNKYENLSDAEIIAIDNLEKLTSPTLSSYKVGKKTKELVHLRIIPKTRIEWFKTENGPYQARNLSKKSCDHVIRKLKLAGVTNASITRQKNGRYNISIEQPLTQSEDEIRMLKQDRKNK